VTDMSNQPMEDVPIKPVEVPPIESVAVAPAQPIDEATPPIDEATPPIDEAPFQPVSTGDYRTAIVSSVTVDLPNQHPTLVLRETESPRRQLSFSVGFQDGIRPLPCTAPGSYPSTPYPRTGGRHSAGV